MIAHLLFCLYNQLFQKLLDIYYVCFFFNLLEMLQIFNSTLLMLYLYNSKIIYKHTVNKKSKKK
jgi:hypothetical protein